MAGHKLSRRPVDKLWKNLWKSVEICVKILPLSPYFSRCRPPLDYSNYRKEWNPEEGTLMARKGWSLTETEVHKIVYLLSETDLVVGDIAERMSCSKTAVISINRRFRIRDYGRHRTTWKHTGARGSKTL